MVATYGLGARARRGAVGARGALVAGTGYHGFGYGYGYGYGHSYGQADIAVELVLVTTVATTFTVVVTAGRGTPATTAATTAAATARAVVSIPGSTADGTRGTLNLVGSWSAIVGRHSGDGSDGR